MNNLEKNKDKVYQIIGAAMTVHTELGGGLLLNFGLKSMYGERYYFDPITNECYLLDKSLNPYKLLFR